MIGQSPILTKHIEEQLRGLIVALFMPIFFGVAGLAIDLKVLGEMSRTRAYRHRHCEYWQTGRLYLAAGSRGSIIRKRWRSAP